MNLSEDMMLIREVIDDYRDRVAQSGSTADRRWVEGNAALQRIEAALSGCSGPNAAHLLVLVAASAKRWMRWPRSESERAREGNRSLCTRCSPTSALLRCRN